MNFILNQKDIFVKYLTFTRFKYIFNNCVVFCYYFRSKSLNNKNLQRIATNNR